jgi:beta-glucosidase
MDRRNFLKTTASASAVTAITAGSDASAVVKPAEQLFPKEFVWGCATAAFQIEGAVKEDGRGQTNWDLFAHTPGRIVDGHHADIACDGYHRFRDDTQLLKSLGVDAYRFSLAWSRIFPAGRGHPNQKGIDHYNRVVDHLLENGIQPYVTLFHWDLPAALPGGWQSRDTANAFADYAGYAAGKLGDRVKQFMTINEFRCYTDLGHKIAKFAPGLRLPDKEVNQIRHHGVLAHGLGLQAVRAATGSDVQVGLADNPNIYIPVIETAEHIAAARQATREENAPFLTAVMEGRYLDTYLNAAGANAPVVMEGDMKLIAAPLDFVGINLYTGQYVQANESTKGYDRLPQSKLTPQMTLPWLYVVPEAAYWSVRHVSDLWQAKKIVISENGCCADDKVSGDQINDSDRIMYLRNYISQMHRAVAEGYPVSGYFLWSLMDNFEWSEGYSARFGIHYTDFATQQRMPKLSAAWYRELIARNRVV